jgi:hypothetical protein
MLRPGEDWLLLLGTTRELAVLPWIVEVVVKLLAVVGGAAVGGGFVGFVARRMARLVARREVPRRPMTALRGLGGIAGGWAIWLMVYSPGGSGLFGGGGSLFGERGSAASGGPEPAALDTTANVIPAAEGGTTLRVTVLGGPRVVDGRFYLVESDSKARTLAELKKIVKDRQGKSHVRTIELLIYEDSVARSHAAVGDLERWAGQNDLTVSMPPTKGVIP